MLAVGDAGEGVTNSQEQGDNMATEKEKSRDLKRPLKNLHRPRSESSTQKLHGNVLHSKPTLPTDDLGKRLYHELEEFVKDKTLTKREFQDADQDSRKRLHELAEEFKLLHYSRGQGKKRFITVEKPQDNKEDEWEWRGYIGLFGNSVDAAGTVPTTEPEPSDNNSVSQLEKSLDKLRIDKHLVPYQHVQQRIKRDGPSSHITLLLPPEVDTILKRIDVIKAMFAKKVEEKLLYEGTPLEVLMNIISSVVEDDWKDLGLGHVTKGNNEVSLQYIAMVLTACFYKAWFKVISWPSAAKFRAEVDLSPKDFHITVGFASSDIYDVSKNVNTLVKNE